MFLNKTLEFPLVPQWSESASPKVKTLKSCFTGVDRHVELSTGLWVTGCGGTLDCSPSQAKQQELFTRIVDFVSQASGLKGAQSSNDSITVEQTIDCKHLEIHQRDLEDVLFRSDTEGKDFIQVNFVSNKKILITDKLIGFKPTALQGLDLAKLPRVVTTPDLHSVFEAIQEALHTSDGGSGELAVLRKVYEAIIIGGESIGFDLTPEKSWIKRIPTAIAKVSA